MKAVVSITINDTKQFTRIIGFTGAFNYANVVRELDKAALYVMTEAEAYIEENATL
ncbi:MAG: hypothetical protein VB133_08530 [Anaeromusa sp.]|uniref:hypothetical protein n=1 Tax=Anaeromusa sp. TaxID=1872520 RepID=UPI002B201F62|nr:hypothetical protein [Anaeromusa sp.]MEA4835166.1 hypothetical protein [Anaeromusa sp.]